jgi:hypothetical protein
VGLVQLHLNQRAIHDGERLRDALMQLASFALTITYAGVLSTPGGFWDNTDGGARRPGDPILKGARLTAFFVCNTTAFVASLLVVVVLLVRKIRRTMAAFVGIITMLLGLLGSYLAGSNRETKTTIYLASLIGAILAYIVCQVADAARIFRRHKRICTLWITSYIPENLRDISKLFDETIPNQKLGTAIPFSSANTVHTQI